jgi:hypothetical protein
MYDLRRILGQKGKHPSLHDLPELPVTKKAADGNGHEAIKLNPLFPSPLYRLDVFLYIPAADLMHVACKTLLDSFSDSAVSGP